jgi:hypothetical protein
MAGFARIEPRDLHLLDRAVHRIPKINLDLVLQVAADFLLRLDGRTASTAAAKKLAEEVAEAAGAGAFASRAAKVTAASSSPPPRGGAAPGWKLSL